MADVAMVPIQLQVTDIECLVDPKAISESVGKSLTGVRKAISNIFENVDTSKFSKSMTNSMGTVIKKVAAAEKAEASYNKALEASGKSSEEYARHMAKMRDKEEELARQIQYVQKLEETPIVKRDAYYAKAYETATQSIKTLERELDTLRAQSDPKLFAEFGGAEQQENMYRELLKLRTAFTEVSTAQKDFNNASKDSKYSDEFQEKVKAAEKLKAQLEQLNEKSRHMDEMGAQGFKSTDKAWAELQQKTKETGSELDSVLRQMRSMVKDGSAFRFEGAKEDVQEINNQIKSINATKLNITGSANRTGTVEARANANMNPYTKEYQDELANMQKLEAEVDKLIEKYKKLKETGKLTPDNTASIAYDVQNLGNKIDESRQKLRGMVNDGSAFRLDTGNAQAELSGIDSRVNDTHKTLNKLPQPASKFGKIMSGVGKGVAASFKGITKVLGSVGKAIGNATKKVLHLGKHGNKSAGLMNGGFKKFFKNFLTFGLGFRTLYYAIKRLRTIFIDGFKAMAKQFPEINGPLSRLSENFNALKGSLATAFQPLVSVAIPALQTFVQYLTKVLEMVARFNATLTGQGKIYKAVAKNVDLAGDSADEAKEKLADYDKLSVISDDKGGDSKDSLGVTYEAEDIGSGVSDFAQKLKDAWTNQDFEGVGAVISEKINGIVETVKTKLTELDAFGTEWGNNIGQIITSLAVNIDFSNIGNTIATGLNAIVHTFNSFMDAIDFGAIGTGISNGINGLISGVDFAAIGTALGQVPKAIIDTLYSLVFGIDWANLGLSLATGAQSMLDQIDFVKLCEALIGGVNSIMTGLDEFIKNIDWYGEIVEIVDGIEAFIMEFDWTEFGKLLSDAVIALIDMAMALILETDWGGLLADIGEGIGDFIAAIDWLGILKKLAVCLVGLVMQIPGIIWGALTGIVGVIAGLFRAIGLDGIAGFFDGIVEKMKNIGKWIKDHIVDPVVNWVKNLFGIHSPSTVFSDFGTQLMQGFFNGISNLKQKVLDIFTKLKTNIVRTFNNLKTSLKTIMEKVWNVIKTPINWIITGFEKLVNGVVNGINTMIRALNKLSFDVPEWVPLIGGETFGFNIKELKEVSIPRLAQGAVIPPNKAFLAMLGDQKSGTNIEAPLETIKQAISEVLAEMGAAGQHGDINLILDGKQIAKVVWDEEAKYYKQTGKYSPAR